MTETRAIGLNMLLTVINKQKNANIFEECIYRKIGSEDEDTYKWCIYQIVGLLLEDKDMKKALTEVKDGKIGWQSGIYDEISHRIEEFDNYLVHPFDVVDGVAECGKCGSKKTWSVQKQTRSSDEPMTTFSRCAECGNSWTYAG